MQRKRILGEVATGTLSGAYNTAQTIVLITSLLFCLSNCLTKAFGQNKAFTDRHTLDFQFTDSTGMGAWQPDSKDILPFVKDTILFNGKYPIGITRFYMKKYSTAPLEAYLRQNIPLCVTDAKEGSLSITLKTWNLVKAELVVNGMDQLETVLYTHRLPILNENMWSTYTSRFSLKGVAMLNVSINLLGGKDSLRQVAWLDRLEMKIDGKEPEVCDENLQFSYPAVSTLTTYPLSLSAPDTYQNIPDLWNHSIVAIGESIHGSQTMNNIGFDFMKCGIEKEGVRLALFELSLESMLAVNRYIQGDERFSLDEILKKKEQVFVSNKKLGHFLNWLKAYNQSQKQKVWLLGMDQASDFSRQLDLFDYFYTINQTAQLPALDSLCVGLLKKRPLPELAEMMRTEPAVQSLFSDTEYQILLHCLTPLYDTEKTYTTRNAPRDHIMFLHTNFLINAICRNQEKTVIYTHLSHANYVSQQSCYFEDASFGSYLKKAYPDYLCIGLFAGEGKCLLKTNGLDQLGFLTHTLSKNIASSLESSLLQLETDYFYISSPASRLSLFRMIGRERRSHPFEVANLAQRVDGLLFVKQSESIELDKTRINPEHASLIWIKKMRENQKKYPGIFKDQ